VVEGSASAKSVPGDSPLAQVDELARDYPDLYAAVDIERVNLWTDQLREEAPAACDFGPSGRGIPYLAAQVRNPGARAVGISSLLRIVLEAPRNTGGHPPLMVDLLGGDGLVRRVCAALGLGDISVLTCDLSPYMVAEAWRKGVPALLQRAEQSLLKSSSVDAVLLAYGSHHIPTELRQTVVSEAYRILRPGGIMLFHDFLHGSATEAWFRDVVDSYSATGHKFPHFSSSDIIGYLERTGFEHCEVRTLADPYMAIGADPEVAEYNMGDYLVSMYGLTRAESEFGDYKARLWAVQQARQIFGAGQDGAGTEGGLRFEKAHRRWTMEIPRQAVLGLGQKPREAR
jgi:ubiquinone/menaquinone biosynthesis C-methylase UbiE